MSGRQHSAHQLLGFSFDLRDHNVLEFAVFECNLFVFKKPFDPDRRGDAFAEEFSNSDRYVLAEALNDQFSFVFAFLIWVTLAISKLNPFRLCGLE